MWCGGSAAGAAGLPQIFLGSVCCFVAVHTPFFIFRGGSGRWLRLLYRSAERQITADFFGECVLWRGAAVHTPFCFCGGSAGGLGFAGAARVSLMG